MASATAESIVRAMRFSSSISAGANGSTSSSTRGTYEAMAALALSARPAVGRGPSSAPPVPVAFAPITRAPEVTTATTTATTSTTSTTMRAFAVIICNDCLYLEFPGCDVHGVLYTERVVDQTTEADASKSRTAGGTKLHAKCPKCTAATNNVRPFRDGCRRCKGPTTVYMWCATPHEVTQAHDSFPAQSEEVEHTALVCELCQSVIFPRAREMLTKRTAQHPLTSSQGKPLKVSNFQLSMPHVEGCTRKGMPVQTSAIQLPKSELKFVLDRIDQCPFVPRIQGGPQYRKRETVTITQQNHLHQLYLRLLSSIVKTFRPDVPMAAEPLRKLVDFFSNVEPLSLFPDWSLPQQFSKAEVKPIKVQSSSQLDDQHSPQKVLESGESSCWRSVKASKSSEPSEEWICFQFDTSVVLSAVILQWHKDFRPPSWSMSVSSDDSVFETIALGSSMGCENRVALSKNTAISHVRISVLPTKADASFALQSVRFFESNFDFLHTPSRELLQSLQNWLGEASASSCDEVRDLALRAFQKLVLSSGSLCGLLRLAAVLMTSSLDKPSGSFAGTDSDLTNWDRLDILPHNTQECSVEFLVQLSLEMQRIMLSSMSQFDTPLLDSRMVQRMTAHLLAHESSDNASSAMLWSNTHDLIAELTKVPNEDDDQADRNESTKESQKEGSLIPVVIFAVCNPSFTQSIKRRSQLAVVILQMLGELSTWQMKRMQKAEEFTGKKEELLTQLEEPFAIEVSPQSFDLAHQLLKAVLQLWLGNLWQQESPEFEEEEVKQDVSVEAKKARLRPSLYTKLDEVCKELIANSSNQAVIGGPGAVLSADSTAIAILQIVTSNIRRLVLSHIDPADIGIEPAAFESHDSLPAAPPALDPLVCLLEQLVSLGAKRTDRFFPVSLKAAAAVEVGMEAFYPSAQQRTLLLTSRMGKGATIEVQVRWPVQERDQEDPRYERLMLMLLFECIKLGLQHTTRGSWQFYMHLIVEIPPDQSTEQTLQRNFAQCIQRAGFSSWQVIAGAQEISINLQRHLHWNRVEKMSQDSGSGWIRIYPRDVATFDDVLVDVNGFISHHEDHSRCEGAHP